MMGELKMEPITVRQQLRNACKQREPLGRMIAGLRQNRGASLQDVAQRTGLGKTTLWRIEQGQMKPSLEIATVLSSFYDVEISEIALAAIAQGENIDLSDLEQAMQIVTTKDMPKVLLLTRDGFWAVCNTIEE